MSAAVFEVQALYDAAQQIAKCKEDIERECREGIAKHRALLDETETEERFSFGLLEAARVVEGAAAARLATISAQMAAADAELVAAIASANPIAIAAATAQIASIAPELASAEEDYRHARAHREALEGRYEQACRCVELARANVEGLEAAFGAASRAVDVTAATGCARLMAAYSDLTGYAAKLPPGVADSLHTWFNNKPEEKSLVRPDFLHAKLKVGIPEINAVLTYMYATDQRFQAMAQSYAKRLADGDSGAEIQIKKNMVGKLCEDMTIIAFRPLADKIITQRVEALEDGSYTKIDLVAQGLKNPVVLGKGEGMGAREGGSLAIEVKSGHSGYLYSQLEHMCKQAEGHQKSNASCVICTADIHDLPAEKEAELRRRLEDAGSPIIGMLPKKQVLDQACIDFIRGLKADV